MKAGDTVSIIWNYNKQNGFIEQHVFIFRDENIWKTSFCGNNLLGIGESSLKYCRLLLIEKNERKA